MAHFIHYVCRTVKMRIPERDGAPPISSHAFESPAVHVTRAVNGTVGKVREGDVIWLVSQLRTPWGTLPPGIDARIEVTAIERNPAATRFIAEPAHSGWVPLCDATTLLRKVRVFRQGATLVNLWPDPARPIGQYLQGMRELHDGDLLEDWYRTTAGGDIEFVSYRQLDGTPRAFYHVANRLRAGRSVFWDRWSLPRGIAERREAAPAHVLDPYLCQAIDRAAVVWGIDSPHYGEATSYSAYEKRYAGSRLVMAPPCCNTDRIDQPAGPAADACFRSQADARRPANHDHSNR